jgi:tetratricopeptide (TPR) repeat protein/tRNA A-37 threonylcarbamoyl transferase component Bud32
MTQANLAGAHRCRRCGSMLGTGALTGVCVRCLALDGVDADDAPVNIEPVVGFSAGRTIGEYELLEEIGRGGMGVVFKARQKHLDRLVAVKVLRSGWLARAGELARFRTEAKTVAGLHHPNIVAVHEVGENDGQPYFSMDFVAGRTLEEIARGHPLQPARAARYVKQIAEAIHYAHEHGVLHRDLKPSNVLVDGDDRPRITDFGLAKQLEGDASLTVTGQVLGSPNFMPPEQASPGRAEISTASDVYSLGGLLYQLLTGLPPFLSETITGTLRLVAENEPASPRLLVPTVPKDLETICLKCLQKEPRQRFATAQELAEDLGRFLRDEPIRARPAGTAEKLWRWCRRNRALAASAAIVAVLLLTVAIGSPIAVIRIHRERNTAAIEAKKSQQVADFLASMLKSVQPAVAQGRDTTLLREMLDQTARRLDTEFTNQPLVEAQLRLVVAESYLSLELGEAGATHARIAWNLHRKVLGETHPDTLDAELLLGEILENSDKWKDAQVLASEVLEHCRKRFGNRDARTSRSLRLLGNALKRERQYPAAIAALREVLEIQKVPGVENDKLYLPVAALGSALIEGGQPVEAQRVFENWLQQSPPNSLTNSLNVAYVKGGLGTALQRQRKFTEGDDLQSEALELKRRLLPPDHPAIGWHLFYWASSFELRKNFAECENLMAKAWDIAERHPSESVHLKHVLAFYGQEWISTWAKTEPAAAGHAAIWQDRLTELQREHPELGATP